MKKFILNLILPSILMISLNLGNTLMADSHEVHVVFQTGGDVLVAREFKDRFEKETKIKLSIEEIPGGNLYEKLVTEFITKSGAYDLVEFYPTWLGGFAEAGYLEPLDDLFDKYSSEIDPDDYLEGVQNAATVWKGKRYGIPYDGDVLIFYYRKDLFENKQYKKEFKNTYGYELMAPDTWDQVLDMAVFFDGREKGLKGIAMVSMRLWWAVGYWSSVYYAYGGRYIDENTGDIVLNRDAWNKANSVWLQMIKHAPKGVLNFGYTESKESIGSGKVAMGIQWATTVFVDPRQSSAHDKLGFAMMPGVKKADGSIYRAPPLPVGKVLAIPKASSNKEKAFKFGTLLSSKEAQIWATVSGTGVDPNRRSVFADSTVKGAWKDMISVYRSSLEIGVADIRVPNSAKYYDIISGELHSVWSGTKSSNDAFVDTLEEWEDL